MRTTTEAYRRDLGWVNNRAGERDRFQSKLPPSEPIYFSRFIKSSINKAGKMSARAQACVVRPLNIHNSAGEMNARTIACGRAGIPPHLGVGDCELWNIPGASRASDSCWMQNADFYV
jgi:hypothetical protein